MKKTKTFKVKVEFVRKKDEASLAIRPGRKLKKAVRDFMEPLGIDPEAVLELLARKALETGAIPLESQEADEARACKPSRATRKAMKEAERMLKHPSKLKTYTIEEALAELKK